MEEFLPIRVAVLLKRTRWFINMRWWFSLSLLIAVPVSHIIFPLVDMVRFASIAGLLIIFNLIYTTIERKTRMQWLSTNQIYLFISLQLVFDYIILSFLLFFSGNISNPLIYIFVFHIIISCMLLPKLLAMMITFGSVTFFLTLSILSQVGILSFYPFPLTTLPSVEEKMSNWNFTIASICFLFVMALAFYFASKISSWLRRREVSLQKALNELKALEDIRMKTMMHVAHDLKAPLTASQSSIKSIMGEYAGPVNKNILKMLEIAYRRINNATNMVKDMFNLIKFDEQMKRGEIKKEKLQLKNLVDEVIETFGIEFEGKQVNWQLDIDKDITIYADARQFKELFSSLFLNALLYSEDPVEVAIKSFMKSGILTVQVKDNGIGISPENREKVFDDFFRTLEAKRISRDRVGLGLTMVKKIIEFYGGRIEIEEVLSERGTTFTISLPGITEEKSSLTEAPQPVRAAGRRFFTPSEEPPSAIDIKW